MNSPILITGAPRSGTGLIARAFINSECWAGTYSQRLSYSNSFIKDKVTEQMQNIGYDIEGQYPLPKNSNINIDWKTNVIEAISNDGYVSGNWMYKDSCSTLLWNMWHNAYPNAKWVIVRRKPTDIINSCFNTGYMKRFKDANILNKIGATNEYSGWLWMIRQYESRFVDMIQSGLNVKVIWPERFLTGDYEQLYEVMEWAGVSMSNKTISEMNKLLKRKVE